MRLRRCRLRPVQEAPLRPPLLQQPHQGRLPAPGGEAERGPDAAHRGRTAHPHLATDLQRALSRAQPDSRVDPLVRLVALLSTPGSERRHPGGGVLEALA